MFNYAMVSGEKITQTIMTPYKHVECLDTQDDLSCFYNSDSGLIENKSPYLFEMAVDNMTVVLSGLPIGVHVETNGVDTFTDDEPLEIEYDIPGVYRIALSGKDRYLDCELEVQVGNS